VPAFIVALQTAGASEAIRLAFELLILTAARTNEIVRATWAEVDLDANTWTIPGAQMKSEREHRVPLSPRAVEILTRAQAIAGDSAFVFHSRSATKPLSNMAFLMLLRRMQHETITTHGFRSSFRD
jgi:integrase